MEVACLSDLSDYMIWVVFSWFTESKWNVSPRREWLHFQWNRFTFFEVFWPCKKLKFMFFEVLKPCKKCFISRVLLTLGGVCNGFKPFWHFFYYIRLFRAPRRFLGAKKIATESWECILVDSKVWSTIVDLLGNISVSFTTVQL